MQQTDSVFSYIYARKAPTITYKRKQHLYGDPSIPRPLSPVTGISTATSFTTSTQQRATPTERHPIPTDDEKENASAQNVIPEIIRQQTVIPTIPTIELDSSPPPPPPTSTAVITPKDIFDLPDDDNDDGLVEIRVASSLHTKHKSTKTKGKGKSTNSQSKTMHKKAPKISSKALAPNQPSGGDHHHHHSKMNSKQKSPSFTRTLSAPLPTTTTAPKSSRPLPIARNLSMLPRLPDTKRRKRNLVSQLKAANGERPDLSLQPGGGGNRFYDISSSDDDDDNGDTIDRFNDESTTEPYTNLTTFPYQSTTTTINTTQDITTTSPTTFSNNYNERMEQEIANLIQTEFGLDNLVNPLCTAATLSPSSSSSSSSQRSCYVPENTIRAPVTYKRHNSNNSNARSFSSTAQTSSDLPLTDLDQDMEQQIQYLLSNDF